MILTGGKTHMVRVRDRFPSLKTLGVAVEYFPCYQNDTIDLHAVDVVLFTIALRGRARHFIDCDEFVMKPGSIGVTAFGQEHDILTSPKGLEKFNLFLDIDYPLPALPTRYQSLLAMMVRCRKTFRHHLNRGFHFEVENVSRMRQTLQRIDSELRNRTLGYAEIVRSCLTEFFIDCCRGAQASGLMPSERQQETFPDWVRQTRSQLDEHFAKPWSLAEIARANHVSVGHLCRTFQSYTGKSIIAYLLDRRIHAATLALETTSDKTLKIALSCGFTDYSYFHRQFRNRTGTSPSDYRSRTQRGKK